MNTTDGVRHYLNSPRPYKSQWHVIRTLKYFYVLVWFAASAGFRFIRFIYLMQRILSQEEREIAHEGERVLQPHS